MSYCRFNNTILDLLDCRNAMAGEDSYYLSRTDLSEEEAHSMDQLIRLCRKIAQMHDDGFNVLAEPHPDGKHADEYEDEE